MSRRWLLCAVLCLVGYTLGVLTMLAAVGLGIEKAPTQVIVIVPPADGADGADGARPPGVPTERPGAPADCGTGCHLPLPGRPV